MGCKSETRPCRPFLYVINCLLQLSLYGVQGATTKTDRQVINKECSEDIPGDTRWQLVDLEPKTCNSQYTTSWDTFSRVEFIRVWCRFWLIFGGHVDTLLQRQAISLWGLSYAGLWWYHTARLFHRPSPGRRRDQPPVVSEQRHPGHISRDSLGGPQCCDASWSHTGFCQVYETSQGTRWIGCWSCALGSCTGNWSAGLVCNYLGQHGPRLVWGWGSRWLLSTGAGSLLWSRCYSGYLWGFSMCPQGDVSIDCCVLSEVKSILTFSSCSLIAWNLAL